MHGVETRLRAAQSVGTVPLLQTATNASSKEHRSDRPDCKTKKFHKQFTSFRAYRAFTVPDLADAEAASYKEPCVSFTEKLSKAANKYLTMRGIAFSEW